MSVVVSFTNYVPPARYDDNPWTQAQIEESDASDGTWTVIDTVTLANPDSDPSDPQPQSFTTSNGTADDMWYRVVFLDGLGNSADPTFPEQNSGSDVVAFADVTELARILKISSPTTAQTDAMTRVLTVAAGEIVNELGTQSLSGWQLALVAEVNLERAAEHWQQLTSPFGFVGLGSELGPSVAARDSWERHAYKLAPLKASWGLA